MVVKRGAGAALLQRPGRLAAIVEAVRGAVDVPLSVKIRLGYSADKLNYLTVARRAVAAGADALGVHGRTRNQRYRLSADWSRIDEVARAVEVPVLGNGDLLTCWDLRRRRSETEVASFLVARGALIKPWVFREMAEDAPLFPTPAGRWAMMRRYVDFGREYFGDDEKGLSRVRRFFLWHLGFWHRYRPWTEDHHRKALPDSVMQTRGWTVDGDGDEALLASADEADHETIWRRVLDGDFPTE